MYPFLSSFNKVFRGWYFIHNSFLESMRNEGVRAIHPTNDGELLNTGIDGRVGTDREHEVQQEFQEKWQGQQEEEEFTPGDSDLLAAEHDESPPTFKS